MTVNLKRFALWYVGITAGLTLVLLAIDYLLNINLQNAGTSMIPGMMAAMVEGQKHAQTTRDPIPMPWKQSAVLAALSMMISLILAIPFLIFSPELMAALQGAFGFVLGFSVVIFLILWLVIRFFLPFGAKNQWKAIDQKAAKSK